MIRWIYRVKVSGRIESDDLLDKLGLKSLEKVLKVNHMQRYGHVCDSNSWIKKYTNYGVFRSREQLKEKCTKENNIH